MKKDLIIGLAIGSISMFLLMLFIVYFPSHNLMAEKERQLKELTEFNVRELKRVSEMRDISETQLKEWASITSENNRQFQEIMNNINRLEKDFSSPGTFYIVLMLIFLGISAGTIFYFKRKENTKDLITFENFQTFIDQRLASANLSKMSYLPTNNDKLLPSTENKNGVRPEEEPGGEK